MSSSADQQNPRQTITSNLLPAVKHTPRSAGTRSDKHKAICFSFQIAVLVAAERNTVSKHFCWVGYVIPVFELCYALDVVIHQQKPPRWECLPKASRSAATSKVLPDSIMNYVQNDISQEMSLTGREDNCLSAWVRAGRGWVLQAGVALAGGWI